MRKRAFTLIELLVVVAIIVVLIAILLPSLGKAREQAKRVTCASNLRQIGTTLRIYFSENRKYPEQNTDAGSNTTDEGMARLAKLDYIKTPKVFWCSSDQNNLVPPTKITTNVQNDTSNNSAETSYDYMYNMYQAYGYNLNQITHNDAVLSVVEELYGGYTKYTKYGNHSPQGGNILFLDSHVDWVLPPWNTAGYGNGYKISGGFGMLKND